MVRGLDEIGAALIPAGKPLNQLIARAMSFVDELDNFLDCRYPRHLVTIGGSVAGRAVN